MAEPSDLEKHRHTLTQRLNALTEDLKHQSQGSQALYEWLRLVHQILQNVEQQMELQEAESLLFQKLFLANARLSKSWDEYKKKCVELEEKLGYHSNK